MKPANPPRLVLQRRFIDMGRLSPQTTKAISVAIRNEGTGELVIHKVEAGCRCFQPTLSRGRLAPGESGSLTVKVLTLKHRGSLSEKIGILSNDPAGVKILTLRFEVPHELAADPPRLYFGIVPPGQEVSRQVNVLATANVNTKVLYTVSNAESLVGRVMEPGLSKTRPAVLEVAVKAPTRPGTYRHSLSITTGLDARPTIRLPVVLSVCNAATVSPERLDFGRFARGQPVTRTIRLTLSKGVQLNVAAAHPEVLDIKIAPGETQGAARVHLTAKKDVPYGPLRGELRLELGGKQECTLAVPFAGYVTEEKHTQ